MKNFWLLISIYLRTSFSFNREKYAQGKQKKNTGMTVLLIFCYAMIVGLVFAMSAGMMQNLQSAGKAYMVLNILQFAAAVMVFITTIYKVNGVLFGFRDYDLQMALPIPARTVIASRIVILYLLNALFVAALMIPAAVAYGLTAAPPFAFYVVYVLLMIAAPMLPLIVATLIGTLITLAASHFKRKNSLNVFFTVAFFMVFMVVWMGFWMNSSSVFENFTLYADGVDSFLMTAYPMTRLFAQAVSGFDMLSFALYLLISAGAFAVFILFVAKGFRKYNTAVTTNRTLANYKMTSLKTARPRQALFHKEIKRYFSSSQYVLNTITGPLLMIVFGVLLLVGGTGAFGVYSDIPGFAKVVGTAGPLVLAFFVAITSPSASAVSLEGRSLWIVRSLPIDARDVLKAKINVTLLIFLPGCIVGGTLFNLALKPDPATAVLMYAVPAAYSYFSALFGLRCDLNNPKLDWTNEVTVVKQSRSVLVTMLVGMLLTIAPVALCVLIGAWMLEAMLALVVVLDLVLYHSLMTKGVRQFNSL